MIIKECKIVNVKTEEPNTVEEKYVEGYFLTFDDLRKFGRDFERYFNSMGVIDTNGYIEEWLKKHERIVK